MLLSISSAKANLLTNGSFEISSINPGAGYLPVYPGETSIVGWDVVSEDVHYMGTFWEASDGIRSIDLDGLVGSAGGVSQTFSTVAGTQYKVTFDMAGNYANLPTLKPMSVSADGQSQEFTFDVTGRSALNMGWTPMSWLFVADDSSATLQFLSLTTTIQGWGPALDNVSVNPVPVPPAVWLFGSGVLGMIGIARRKKAA
jgi:choice-of-anchor C domain-containing protein